MTEIPQSLDEFMDKSTISLSLGDPSDPEVPLLKVNERFCQLTGYSRDEVLGRNCRFLQGNHRDQEALDKVRAHLASDSDRPLRVELVNLKKDGTPFINLLTLTRICNPRGETCFIFASQFDISRATGRDLQNYDEQLAGELDRRGRSLRDNQLFLIGSMQMVGDTAATIARARMMLTPHDEGNTLY